MNIIKIHKAAKQMTTSELIGFCSLIAKLLPEMPRVDVNTVSTVMDKGTEWSNLLLLGHVELVECQRALFLLGYFQLCVEAGLNLED